MTRWSVWALLPGLIVLAGCGDGSSTSPTTGLPSAAALTHELSAVRTKYHVPAIAAVVVNPTHAVVAASGVRKQGATPTVTPNDRFHIGSNTKAMTATLIATLVRDGLLTWDTQVLAVYPELAGTIDPLLRNTTVRQLLQHRAGIPAYETTESLAGIPPLAGSPPEQRRTFTLWQLTQPPAVTPGTYHYSNGGYAILGAIAEAKTGTAYETLMAQRVFTPLGATAGFGWPAAGGAAQPWGHLASGTLFTPQDPDDPTWGFPPIGVPAGDTNLAMADYGKFLQAQLHGLRGADGLLPAALVQQMHTPNGDGAMGWSVSTASDGYPVSFHIGSAGTFYCFAVIAPHTDTAFAVAINAGNDPATPAADAAVADVAMWIIKQ